MTEGTRNRRAWLLGRTGIVIALSLVAVLAVSSATAMSFKLGPRHLAAAGTSITAKQHEGQRSDGTYTSGNITQYKEGDTINFRLTLASDDAASGQLQVRFTGDDGSCLFFANYFVLGSIDNVSGTSPTVGVADGPTPDGFGTSNGEWVVTLNVSFADAGQAVVNYQLKLSNAAGDCSGSSQHSRLSPLDGVSQTGQQNVPVPANQIIELPNITVTKLVDRGTGTFVPADAGEYCFTLDSGTCTAVDASGQVTFASVSDGSHTITESSNLAHPGYTFDSGTGTNCTFSGSTATATVASGTTATNAACTFKNKLTAPPKVTVTKSCPNGAANSGDRFQVQLNGSSAGSALACGGSLDVNPTAGQAYAITEAAAGTTDFANYTSSLSAGCSGTLSLGGTAACTITNALKPAPKVTVTKSCPNGPAASGDRFQVTNNGANVGSALACGESIDVSVTAGQAYTISEGAAGTTDLSNYTSTTGAGCSGTLAHFGDTSACTITNTLKAGAKVTVTKSCPNGAASSGDRFQVKINGTNDGSPLACGDSTDVTVTAGQAYAITEGAAGTTDLANYDTTSSAGCSGTLAHFGDTASCTITNTLKAAPKVTVTKACPGGAAAAGDRFQVKRDGTNVGSALACGGSLQVAVTAGAAYAITEGAAGTTNLANYDTTSSAGCSGTLAHYGDTANCTITNTLRAAPKVAVTKTCPGGPAAAGDRFQVKRDGTNAGSPLACGDTLDVTLTAGQAYTITEGAAGTTDLANYTTALSAGCSGTLANYGDTATCTITNTLKAAPKLTVTKACPGGKAAAGDRFQANLDGSTLGAPLDCGDSVDATVAAGQAYSVTEAAAGTTDLANYDATLSAGCSGTLAHYGDTATCTITNTLKGAPKVAVTKACPGGKAASGDRFQPKLDGSAVGDALDCGDSAPVTVTPGAAYAITEGAAGTTDLANYTGTLSAGCAGTLDHYGDTATCTITNTLKPAPKVTVTKACPNGKAATGDRFQAKRNDTNVGDPLDCTDSIDVTVTAGQAYAITEGAAGTTDLANYDSTSSAGCSGTLAHYGETATCTITNTLKAAPKLTVIKHVVNNEGGTKSASDFTLTVSGSTPSPASFPGSEAGTVVTLKPGPYAVNEAAVSGYATSKSAGCSGTLVHYGDTATCTVTNDDIAAPPPPTGPPLIDLAITKTDAPDPVSVGGLLTYTLTVTNKKGDTANNVIVTDSLPSEVTLVSVAATKGSCSGSIAITCNLGTVAYNELVTIAIVVRPTTAGTITNTAVVAGREAEHDPSDNTASASTLVQGAFTPPSACYAIRVTPRSLTVGRRTVIRVSLREVGKPVGGVQVVVSGMGLTKRARTNASGVAALPITPTRPGILQIRVPTHATCNRQRIGVVGVFTPPVTG
jgi:large repetitive protein